MKNEIIFESWHKDSLIDFMNFFRNNEFKEFVKVYGDFENWRRGN